MLGACSSDKDVADGGNGTASEGNEGYINVSINLPTTPAVTKADPDKGTAFEDGTPKEYAVNKAWLLLFKGSSESAATFYSIAPINPNMGIVSDDPNQITTQGTITTKVDVPTQADGLNLYSYVILNDCGLITIPTAPSTTYKLCGVDLDSQVKLATLQSMDMGAKLSGVGDITGTNGFLMSNAPLSTIQGGATSTVPTASVKVLSDVDWNKIYSTEAQALADGTPATEVYVERAMAKVTMNKGSQGQIGSTGIYYDVVSWGLDVTNKTSNFARSTTGFDDNLAKLKTNSTATTGVTAEYRMIGFNPIESGKSLYRTYWAQDPNYNTFEYDATTFASNFNSVNTLAEGTTFDNPQYCFENTFDVNHQNQNETTRVIVGLTLKSGSNGTPVSFYTIDGLNKIYTLDKVKDEVKATILSDATVKTWLTTNFTTTVSGKSDIDENNIEVTLDNENPSQGIQGIKVKEYKLINVNKKSEDGPDASAITNQLSVETLVDMVGEINFYYGGVSYYPIRIKHFGDLQTPWDNGETPTPQAGDGYPSTNATNRDGNYLGRYGVLRNNWYDISVSEVLNIGSPVIPSVPTTDIPDDVKNSYIKAKINVLSWAKRTQGAILK